MEIGDRLRCARKDVRPCNHERVDRRKDVVRVRSGQVVNHNLISNYRTVKRSSRRRRSASDERSGAERSASRFFPSARIASIERSETSVSGYAGKVTGPTSYNSTSISVRSTEPSSLYSQESFSVRK